MSFLAPLFLLGGLAIALPVVFHLVRRSSREKQIFSSLMFLKPTPPRMTRRNRLENIFLLLLRCLAISILAFAFARPFLPKPMAATPGNPATAQVVILVDTSASMKREGLWADAKAKAVAALEQVAPADQVALLTFDDRVRTLVSFEQWAAMNATERSAIAAQRIAETQPTWRATQLGNALIAAAEAIEDAEKREQPAGPRRIVLITDLQEGSRLDGLQGHEWPRGLEIAVAPVKARRPTNAGLQWVVEADDSAPVTGETPLRLRVHNSADANREQFKIHGLGLTGDSIDAYIPPGRSRIVPGPKLATNGFAGQITLSGDDDDFDNTVYVMSPKAEDVNVLYLGNDSDSDTSQLLYYLRRAFQDTRRQTVSLTNLNLHSRSAVNDTRPAGESSGVSRALATSRLVIVPDPLSDAAGGEVRQFITNGGTALLVMNDPQTARTISQLTGVPEVTASEAAVANYAMFGRLDFTHPLLAPFDHPRFGDFTKIRFWHHRQLPTNQLPGGRILASYDDNDAAILEVLAGRGRLFVFTFSWRPADSQFALSSKFVPLLYSLLDQAGGVRPQLAQFRVGDAVDLAALATLSGGAAMSVRKPDGVSIRLASEEPRFTQTDQPGIYEVLAAPKSVPFVVNLDAAESRTAPLPTEELERLGVPIKATVTSPAPAVTPPETLPNAELEARQKIWRWLIVAALAVLLVETWLAGWITRRPASRAEATA